MKRIGTYVVVALVAAAIGAFATSKWMDGRLETTVIKYDTVIERVVDSVPFNLLDTAKVQVQPVKIVVPSSAISTTVIVDSIEVETTKYTGQEELDNGTIDWTIYADRLYATSFRLETDQKTITKTVTKTLPTKSRLYAFGGLDFLQERPSAMEVGLMYNRRQKWGVGASIRQDFSGLLPREQNTYFGLKVFVGL